MLTSSSRSTDGAGSVMSMTSALVFTSGSFEDCRARGVQLSWLCRLGAWFRDLAILCACSVEACSQHLSTASACGHQPYWCQKVLGFASTSPPAAKSHPQPTQRPSLPEGRYCLTPSKLTAESSKPSNRLRNACHLGQVFF